MWASAWQLSEVRWASGAAALFVAGLVSHVGGAPAWLSSVLYAGCYLAGGWRPGLEGLKTLRHRSLDVDLLMVVAAVGAFAIGQVVDGALLIVIFATSGALEAVATKRTRDSVHALLDLAPERATRLTPSGDEETVAATVLDVGQVLVIRPGERIGGDGVVVDGASEVDEASITGESLPAAKLPGNDVFAGTVNGSGTLRVRVTRPAADTVVARTVALVAEAGASRASRQLMIERIEQKYSVLMVAATIALLAVPVVMGSDVESALLRAMTFMIVASPCALVLSTMPPLLSAIANAGRHGVLVKSAVVLEKLSAVDVVAFDKTGTLTEGTPRLAHVRPVSAVSAREVVAVAAAAEHSSEHPLGRAVVAAAAGIGIRPAAATAFVATPGVGVRAVVAGMLVEVSRPTAVSDGAVSGVVDELEKTGHTVVVVRRDGLELGVLGFSDRLRDNAAEMVQALTALTGRTPVLLTGDNERAALRVANDVGIDDVRAGLLPQDKVDAVRRWESRGARVMVVGDGVNDAPAMAAATVGVAMGRSGSDLALDTADAVITRDDLRTLPAVVSLARRAQRLVVANLTIAATFIVALVAWDLLGHLPLPLGVAGHEGSTIVVALNGLRLLRDAAWTRCPHAEIRPQERLPRDDAAHTMTV